MGRTRIVDELHSLEHFGPLAVDLLMKLTSEELARFQALVSDAASSAEDYAHDFFMARGAALTAAARIEAEDDDTLGRMFRRWIRNWLIDLHANTALGALRDRLEKRLARDARFERAPAAHFWFLVGESSSAGRDDVAALSAIARRAHVTFYPEPPGGKRRAQLGKPGELEGLLSALFLAAQGSLHISTLVAVLAARFPHVLDPCTIPDHEENSAAAIPERGPSPIDHVVEQEENQLFDFLAKAAFERLSVEEQKLLPVLDDAKAASQVLGLGRSATAVRMSALKSKLIEIAGDEMNAHEILRRVIALCKVEGPIQDVQAADTPGLVPSLQDGGLNP